MTMRTVKLLVKIAGPDGVHMPGDLVLVGASQAERYIAARMAIGPDDPMPVATTVPCPLSIVN